MSHLAVPLTRKMYTPMGTFGTLDLGGIWECYTLELLWKDNARGISCIPCGTYPLRRSRYNQGGYDCWEICDVDARDEIKMHIGNTIDDIRGCVVMGKALGYIKRKWAVTSSGIAFREFMYLMEPHETAEIVISERLEPDGS